VFRLATQEQICFEMNLTYNQFRLLKSRAKAKFGEMGKALAQRRSGTETRQCSAEHQPVSPKGMGQTQSSTRSSKSTQVA
jgi:hypothetical protein